MYKSELHNAKETKEIIEKGPPDVFFRWYYKKKKGPTHHPGDNTVKTSKIDQLEGRIDKLEGRFDKLEGRFDRLEESINNLAKEMRAGFKQVNNRIDNLEKDVNSLKQDVKNINARLDYNGLKKLPENR